jgi:hypothetical protein
MHWVQGNRNKIIQKWPTDHRSPLGSHVHEVTVYVIKFIQLIWLFFIDLVTWVRAFCYTNFMLNLVYFG